MKKVTNEWLDRAKDDLDTIKEIISKQYLTNIVAFHSQQAIEKCFKAIIEEFEIGFIKEHNLEVLLNKIEKYINFEINIQLLKEVNKIYTISRYPGELGLLPDGKPTIKQAKHFFEFAKNIFEKINSFLQKSE
jgi:HEPN domain-containing protein